VLWRAGHPGHHGRQIGGPGQRNGAEVRAVDIPVIGRVEPGPGISGEGTSTRNPRAVRSPPLLTLIAASNDARYSVIQTPRSRVRLQIPHDRERIGPQYTSIRWPSGSRHLNAT
jgi:hypothetical protein